MSEGSAEQGVVDEGEAGGESEKMSERELLGCGDAGPGAGENLGNMETDFGRLRAAAL